MTIFPAMVEKNHIMQNCWLMLFAVLLTGCGSEGEESTHNECISVANPAYHISYYEMCGNTDQPITAGTERSLALWFEVDSPTTSAGKVWVDDIFLERSDRPGMNMLSNSGFDFGLWTPPKNNKMMRSDGTQETWLGLIEWDDTVVWSIESGVASADMSRFPDAGYQTHIFQLIPLPEGIPAGITLHAHARIKIEGNVQCRLGLDLRDTDIDPSSPRGSIRSAVNGLYVRGTTDGWRRLDLR